MDTLVLQNALRACAERVTKLDVYVVHHAANFADAVLVLPLETDIERLLCRLIGIESIARAERCPHFITYPSDEAIRLHARWLLSNLPTHGHFGKWCRWVGFAGGAAARIRLPKGYYCKDIANPGDIERFIALAYLLTSSRHYVAHVALGYLQGWLWAHGEDSIETYKQMNKPPTPALAP